MHIAQNIITLDLEGVLLPEMWKHIADSTHISELALTTRDIKDYDELMTLRINALKKAGVRLSDMQNIIKENVQPLEGAVQFLKDLSAQYDVIIVSDTFLEFFDILRPALNYPVIFCNSFIVENDIIQNYSIRVPDGKTKTVKHLQELNFVVLAAGDSYNDIGMLQQANLGILFRAPEKITKEYPNLPACSSYTNLKTIIDDFWANH